MKSHVTLDQTVRPRFRHGYTIDGATIRLTAQSALIEHHDPQVIAHLRAQLLGQWLPDGMYVGSYHGKPKGPAD